jgi:ABC-type uncharacterized transport system permease subunit
MSAVTTTAGPAATPVLVTVVPKSWKVPIILAVFTVIAFGLFVALGRDGTSTFTLSTPGDFVDLPPLGLPTRVTCIVLSIVLLLITALSVWFVQTKSRVPLWISVVFAILFLVAFLTWASAGALPGLPVPGMLFQTIVLSIPLIFGALGGVISERVGVVNVAIEGQLLAGAFVSAIVGSITHQPLLGLVGAMVAGVLV